MIPANPTRPAGQPAGRFFTFANKVPLQAGQRLGFTAGRGYYARTAPAPAQAPPRVSAPPAGTAPAPPQQQPSDAELAQQQVMAVINPLIASIQQAEQARAAQGQQLIGGYTQSAQDALKGIDFGAPYTGAAQSQNAINTALMQNLQGQGSSLQSELAGQLSKADVGGNLAQTLTGNVASDTAGAAGAGLASGDASLSQLIADKAAAQGYGMKLPALEALAGFQDTSRLQGTVNADLANQLGQVQAKVPEMTQAALSGLATGRYQQGELASRNDANRVAALKAQTAHQDANTKMKVALLIAQGRIGEAEKVASENNSTRVGIANANNQARVGIAAENRAAAQAKTSFSQRIQFAKAYGYDPVTGAVLPGFAKNGQGRVVKTSTATKGQLTDNEVAKLVKQWHDGTLKPVTTIARDAKGNPIPNSAGAPETTTQTVPTGQLKYGQAYAMLRTFGRTDQQARQVLNTVYARGDNGRAWVTNNEQAALKRAGLPPQARVVKTTGGNRGFLTMKQYQAIKAAGLEPPPGKLYQEGFLIDPSY